MCMCVFGFAMRRVLNVWQWWSLLRHVSAAHATLYLTHHSPASNSPPRANSFVASLSANSPLLHGISHCSWMALDGRGCRLLNEMERTLHAQLLTLQMGPGCGRGRCVLFHFAVIVVGLVLLFTLSPLLSLQFRFHSNGSECYL